MSYTIGIPYIDGHATVMNMDHSAMSGVPAIYGSTKLWTSTNCIGIVGFEYIRANKTDDISNNSIDLSSTALQGNVVIPPVSVFRINNCVLVASVEGHPSILEARNTTIQNIYAIDEISIDCRGCPFLTDVKGNTDVIKTE